MSRCSKSVLSNPWAGKGHLVTVQTLQEFGGEERRKTLLELSHNMCYVRASRAFKTQNGSLLNCMHKDPETSRSALGGPQQVTAKCDLSVDSLLLGSMLFFSSRRGREGATKVCFSSCTTCILIPSSSTSIQKQWGAPLIFTILTVSHFLGNFMCKGFRDTHPDHCNFLNQQFCNDTGNTSLYLHDKGLTPPLSWP